MPGTGSQADRPGMGFETRCRVARTHVELLVFVVSAKEPNNLKRPSVSTKEPFDEWLVLQKEIGKIRHPMCLD